MQSVWNHVFSFMNSKNLLSNSKKSQHFCLVPCITNPRNGLHKLYLFTACISSLEFSKQFNYLKVTPEFVQIEFWEVRRKDPVIRFQTAKSFSKKKIHLKNKYRLLSSALCILHMTIRRPLDY